MNMKVIVINGPMGVGKTTVGKRVADRAPGTAFLDGDWCMDIHPFVGNRETKAMAVDNILHMIGNYQKCSECRMAVVAWLMDDDRVVRSLTDGLSALGAEARCVTLLCDAEILAERWKNDRDCPWRTEEWLKASLSSLPYFASRRDILDTTWLDPDQAAEMILRGERNVFETDRLILRPWHVSDAGECYRYAKDPLVGPVAGWPAHTDIQNSLQVIRDILSAKETYAIVLRETGLPVGSVGLHHNDLAEKEDEAELGYWLGVPYWGRGIVPEAAGEALRHAFEDLGLRRVWCGYYDGNEKSRRVQEKLGFKYQWTSQDVPVPQMGETRKGHVSLLTREEWLEHRGRFSVPAGTENRPLCSSPAFIWDLDGTLLDSYGAIVEAAAGTAAEAGLRDPAGDVLKAVKRGTVREYLTDVSARSGRPLGELIDRYRQLTHGLDGGITLTDGAKETLEELRRAGAVHFVFTHRGDSSGPILERLGILGYFREVVTSGYGFRPKPSGEGVRYLAEKYGLDPVRTWYVGDRTLDVKCAKDAGVRALLYLPPDACVSPTGQEDLIVRDLREIPRDRTPGDAGNKKT